MGVKNINFFEQHIEKIVLGAAAAGAAFMAYMATQPISLPNEDIKPANIEQSLAGDLQRLTNQQNSLEKTPVSRVEPYYENLRQLAQSRPLDASLLADVPPMGPRNVLVGTVPPLDPGVVIKAPEPVMPLADDRPEKVPAKDRVLRAQVLQLQVNTDKPRVDGAGVPVPLPAGAQLPVKNVSVVAIDGFVPVGRMIVEMLKVADVKARVPVDAQQTVIYRVEVQRKEQAVGGNWSDWKDVPLPKGAAVPPEVSWNPDASLADAIKGIQAGYKQILLPDFYRNASGQPIAPEIANRPIPDAVQKEKASLDQQIALLKANAVGGGAIVAPVAVSLPAIEQVKDWTVLPFAAWDETVLPDHQYQYKVRFHIVNPTFSNKGAENKNPLLVSEWMVVPVVVVVHSDLAFFLNDFRGIGGEAVSGNIYKQENGRWFAGTFTAKVGAPVAGPVTIGLGQSAEVDTKFTIVDCQPVENKPNSYHVILRDPSGNLITREIPEDFKKTERSELDDKVRAGRAFVTSTAPGDGTGTTTPPTATPTATPPSTPATRRGPVLVNPPGRRGTTNPAP